MIEAQTNVSIDISRINLEDEKVYDMLCNGDTVGIFQIESAAQMQTIHRLRPRNIQDMAYEVACVRPGVSIYDGIRQFINRRNGKKWNYDHPLEKRALKRTLGIILYQDQVNQLAIDIGMMSPYEADQCRRAFTKKNNSELIEVFWRKFRDGARINKINDQISTKIFNKFSGQYMFPESHAVAFGVTAYQLAWLKYYYPLEFTTALYNQQPMGFWGLETIKEDARRHGILILNPDINKSNNKSIIEGHSIRLGLFNVIEVGNTNAETIVKERNNAGQFKSLEDFMNRTGCKRVVVENLVKAGGFDFLSKERRDLLWEVGIRYRTKSTQFSMNIPIKEYLFPLNRMTEWEKMINEYSTLGMYPKGNIMEMLRPYLHKDYITSKEIQLGKDGQRVKIAGLVARPLQHPRSNVYFITLQDEFGFIPLIIWNSTYEKFKLLLKEPLLIVEGHISRKHATLNVEIYKAINPSKFIKETSFLTLPRPEFR
jgi:error-prone DNA polymerase